MINIIRRITQWFAPFALLLAVICGNAAMAATDHAPSEAIVWANAGVTSQQISDLATNNGYKVIPLLMDDVYRIVKPTTTKGRSGSDLVDASGDIISLYQKSGLCKYVGQNRLAKLAQVTPSSTPNDPRYAEQWGLPLMKAPAAWDVEKGKSDVVAVVIDSGCVLTHPDLNSPRLMKSLKDANGNDVMLDPGDLDNDPSAVYYADDAEGAWEHGTHVMGIIGATANNGIGVSGVAQQNVNLLPIKIARWDATNKVWTLPEDAQINSIKVAINAKQFLPKQLGVSEVKMVVNMSWGGNSLSDTPDLNDPLNALLLQAANNYNILFAISAGNGATEGNYPFYPANMASQSKNIFCIASVGPTSKRAYYSTYRPYTTIAAPGGDMSMGSTAGILSCGPNRLGAGVDDYIYMQGTSMASPMAAGAISILLSKGFRPDTIKDILTRTANAATYTVPNAEVGYGIIDLYKAVTSKTVSITLNSSNLSKTAGVYTFRTKSNTFQFNSYNTSAKLITAKLDDEVVDAANISYTSVDDKNGVVDITVPSDTGTHILKVTAANRDDHTETISETVNFNVSPYVYDISSTPAKMRLISLPIYQHQDDSTNSVPADQILSADVDGGSSAAFTLLRWLPSNNDGAWSSWSSTGSKDALASFENNGVVAGYPALTAQGKSMSPVGLGYFVKSNVNLYAVSTGTVTSASPYEVQLQKGWNLIGNPYTFDVAWNGCQIKTDDGNTYGVTAAATENLILPNVYGYDNGSYYWLTAPFGLLRAWEGYWIKALEPCKLVFNPASGEAAKSKSNTETWNVKFGLTLDGQPAGNVVIGGANNASDGYDLLDVIAPPAINPNIKLMGVDSALLKDVRSNSGNQKWYMTVPSDGTKATISWSVTGSVPSRSRLMITDLASGSKSIVSKSGDITCTPGSKLLVEQLENGTGNLRISSMRVRPSRSGAVSVDYTLSASATVKATVYDASGKSVADIPVGTKSSGPSSMSWNGKNREGVSLPAGLYTMTLDVTNEEGNRVTASQPVVLVR